MKDYSPANVLLHKHYCNIWNKSFNETLIKISLSSFFLFKKTEINISASLRVLFPLIYLSVYILLCMFTMCFLLWYCYVWCVLFSDVYPLCSVCLLLYYMFTFCLYGCHVCLFFSLCQNCFALLLLYFQTLWMRVYVFAHCCYTGCFFLGRHA